MTCDYKVTNFDHHEAIIRTRRMEEGPPGSVTPEPLPLRSSLLPHGPLSSHMPSGRQSASRRAQSGGDEGVGDA